MQDFAITSQRNLDRATHQLHALERYAERRDHLIGALDLDSLGPNQLCHIYGEDDDISEALAWGNLYIGHLAQMKALGARNGQRSLALHLRDRAENVKEQAASVSAGVDPVC